MNTNIIAFENPTAVNEYIAEHGTVPPGVDVVRQVAISVNRPK